MNIYMFSITYFLKKINIYICLMLKRSEGRMCVGGNWLKNSHGPITINLFT